MIVLWRDEFKIVKQTFNYLIILNKARLLLITFAYKRILSSHNI